ncbi:DUF6476 family protein [Albidovulum sp.]
MTTRRMDPVLSDNDEAPDAENATLPPDLRFLKLLVTILTGTMIAGLITIIVLFVTRLPSPSAVPVLPAAITLPAGTSARAVTYGEGWIGVLTDDDSFILYDGATGRERQRIRLTPAP